MRREYRPEYIYIGRKFDKIVSKSIDYRKGNFTTMTQLLGELSIAHQRLLIKDGVLAEPDWDFQNSKSEQLLDVLSDLLFDIAIFGSKNNIKIGDLILANSFDDLRIQRPDYGVIPSLLSLLGELSTTHHRVLNEKLDPRYLTDKLVDLLYDLAIFAYKHDVALILAMENKLENIIEENQR